MVQGGGRGSSLVKRRRGEGELRVRGGVGGVGRGAPREAELRVEVAGRSERRHPVIEPEVPEDLRALGGVGEEGEYAAARAAGAGKNVYLEHPFQQRGPVESSGTERWWRARRGRVGTSERVRVVAAGSVLGRAGARGRGGERVRGRVFGSGQKAQAHAGVGREDPRGSNRSRARASARSSSLRLAGERDATKCVSLLLNRSARKSQRIAEVRGSPSSGPDLPAGHGDACSATSALACRASNSR